MAESLLRLDSRASVPRLDRPPSASSASRMHVFLTVGSTRFDALVHSALAPPVLDALRAKGYHSLDIQCGNSDIDPAQLQLQQRSADHWHRADHDLEVNVWRFKPSLKEDYERADLIISHAGSGTIIDVLRLGKPLIVVPNPTLLDNHQEELSDALAGLGHLRSSTVAELPKAIEKLDTTQLVPFPQFDGSRFRELLDEEMGFVDHDHTHKNGAGR
ncbi:glycosyl transferase [Trametes elegans]|nr:glycosyl transferase [Trametes elegans]